LEKTEKPDGEITLSNPQQTLSTIPSTTLLTASSSSFFSSASSSTASTSKDESIISLAAKMAATITDTDSTRVFLSSLKPETYELLRDAMQEKIFEDEMRSAIRSQV
jgi:hypothetical protein